MKAVRLLTKIKKRTVANTESHQKGNNLKVGLKSASALTALKTFTGSVSQLRSKKITNKAFGGGGRKDGVQ